MAENTTTHSRKFLGKTEEFKDKTERAFHQKMLKAYLKGQEKFRFGFKNEVSAIGIAHRVPAYYVVQQKVA